MNVHSIFLFLFYLIYLFIYFLTVNRILKQLLWFTVYLHENTVKNHENAPFTVKLP